VESQATVTTLELVVSSLAVLSAGLLPELSPELQLSCALALVTEDANMLVIWAEHPADFEAKHVSYVSRAVHFAAMSAPAAPFAAAKSEMHFWRPVASQACVTPTVEAIKSEKHATAPAILELH